MIRNRLKMLVGGEAGDGIFATSDMMALAFARSGLEVFTTQWYSSRIRGGHIHTRLRVDEKALTSQGDDLDLLFAMDHETVELHRSKIVPGGILLYDNSDGDLKTDDLTARGVRVFPVPAKKLANKELSSPVVKNVILVGAAFAIVDFDTDFDTLRGIIGQRFTRKGQEIVEKNIAAARLGLHRVRELGNGSPGYKLQKMENGPRLLITGNEAIALGALVAGCRFISGYPITPATDILEYLAEKMPKYNGVVVQAEDELAAINMAIGAGYAGVRAMTATSGPGLSLMVEGLGLASITETPVVVVDVQRVGPSTGMPTRTEQGDLNLLVYGSHGDSPRIVLAPGNLEDCFYITIRAFNLAEKYQCPVFIASDQFLSQGKRTVPPFDLDRVSVDRGRLLTDSQLESLDGFLRYAYTDTGVSARSIPSQRGGVYKATGVEHDDRGNATEKPAIRARMMDKIFKKMETARGELHGPKVYGDENAQATVVTWGSTLGPAQEAMERLWEEGNDVKLVHLTDLWPFPDERVAEILSASTKNICVESNYSGQLAGLIRGRVGIDTVKLLSYTGDPMAPGEVYRAVKEVLTEEPRTLVETPFSVGLRVPQAGEWAVTMKEDELAPGAQADHVEER